VFSASLWKKTGGYFTAFGSADQGGEQSLRRNTIVKYFRMTKPVTGVALMQLYEKGMFQLDDPLLNTPPNFPI